MDEFLEKFQMVFDSPPFPSFSENHIADCANFFFSSGNWDGILTHYALNVIMHVCRKGAYMEDTGPELCSDAPPDPLGQGLFSSPENQL